MIIWIMSKAEHLINQGRLFCFFFVEKYQGREVILLAKLQQSSVLLVLSCVLPDDYCIIYITPSIKL